MFACNFYGALWYPQAQMLRSFSACWQILLAGGLTISECLFLHCLGYRMEAHQLLQRRMQVTCVTWSPNCRLVSSPAHCGEVVLFWPTKCSHIQVWVQDIYKPSMYLWFHSQGSRMDEQRCSAPHILQNTGTPSPQRKDQRTADTSDKPVRRSGSLNRAKTDQQKQVIHRTSLHHLQRKHRWFASSSIA